MSSKYYKWQKLKKHNRKEQNGLLVSKEKTFQRKQLSKNYDAVYEIGWD